MYRITIDFHNRLMKGEVPVSYILIETHMGYRTYAEKELIEIFDPVDPYIFDGSWILDGSVLLGSVTGIIEKSARVISFGSFSRSLQSVTGDVLGAYQSKILQHMSIELDNSDRYFSQLIASEPFIGRPLTYYVGFEGLPHSEHLELFSGMITEMSVMPTLTIEANEE